MVLEIPSQQAERMLAHARDAYPDEACGLLIGRTTATGVRVERVVPTTNVAGADRAHRYEIAPHEFLAAERAARDQGHDVVGFFHSHPDHPAIPSSFDLASAWSYYAYVIVSLERGRVAECRAWRLADGGTAFEAISLADGAPFETRSRPENP